MCREDPVTTVFIALPALIGGQHAGRNPACPPPAPMRPLCCILNVRVSRTLPTNVHAQGRARASVEVAARGSVDRSSWKQTCAARNSGMARNNKFLKMSCDWNRPMEAEALFSFSFFLFFEEAKLLRAAGRVWTQKWLLKHSVVPVILRFKQSAHLFPLNIGSVGR